MIAELNTNDILHYCEKHSHNDSDLLKELIQYTFDNEPAPQMISGLQVGNVLQSYIMASKATKILEIGMFTGYSALKMAEIMKKMSHKMQVFAITHLPQIASRTPKIRSKNKPNFWIKESRRLIGGSEK